MKTELSTETLSILTPVFNEQSFLARIVERALDAPLPGNLKRELVIVNDASTDRTADVIKSLCEKHSEIRAFEQPYNQGKGAAIRRAIQEMTGEFAIIQDADLEYDPNDYQIVLKPLVEGLADAVYGSRFATREMRRVMHYHHKLGNLFLTHLSNWTTGLDLTDMETCYKAFRSELIKSIPLRSNRFGIEPEITAKLAKREAVIYEVPISYHGRRYDEGKKIGWKDGISAVKTIVKYWFIDDCYHLDSEKQTLQMTDYARNYTRWVAKLAAKRCGEKIIEIGAGIGLASRYLAQRNQLAVTETDSERLKILRNLFDGNQTAEVFEENVSFDSFSETIVRKTGKFDTVVLLDHLAKTSEPDELLTRLKNLLSDDGKILLTVPLLPFLFGNADRIVGRVRRFSKREILSLLKRNGFQTIEYRSFNALAVPGLLFLKFLRKKKLGKYLLKIYHTFLPASAYLERVLPFPRANALIVVRLIK
ncbi:MAG: glycosyltransferase [Planctomycetaceae bacterium]|jgi:SAM-dependent methyltransferase|nr:glycosyltransferase [Planctomycetaceae bacterium]